MRYHATRPPLLRLRMIYRELRATNWPTDETLAVGRKVDPRTIRRQLKYLRD